MGLFSNETSSGTLSGAMAGAQVAGPIGAVVGGVIGFFGGSRARKKRRKAEKQQRMSSMRSVRDTVGEQVAHIRKQKTDLGKAFDRDVSSAKAKFAASGASLGSGSWDAVYGSLVKERDTEMSAIAESEAAFRESETYKMYQENLTDAQGIKVTQLGKRGSSQNQARYQISGITGAGEDLYTKEQRAMLRQYTGSGGPGDLFKEYAAKVGPSMEDYEKYAFGSAEDKTAFSQLMTDRINEANKWYDTQLAASQVTKANENKFNYTGRGR